MEIMVKLKLKKMLVIFQILMILWPTAFALASTVNIGDTLNIERGGLGFYTIQYWSDYRDKWMYITYSRTYYTDQDGNKKIAYCMDQDLDGVGWLPGEYENYDALVREELRNDKIWQVLKHGYPNVSPQDLGVETEDDAYLATKQAVYWIIKHGNEPNAKIENIYTHFRAGETEINNQNLEDIQRRGKKVVDAIYKLVNIAANEQREEIIHPEVIQEDNFIIDKDNNYYSAKYKVTEANVKSKIIIDEIDYANDDIFTADINGNQKTEFLPGETFKVMIPKKSIVEGAEARVDYTIKSELDVLYYVASKIEGKQNYVIFSNRIEEGKSKILLKIPEKQSEIQILKVSSDTGEPMSGVKFQITYEDGRKRICTTNQNGYVHCDHMPSGKFIVEEIETNEGYVLDEKALVDSITSQITGKNGGADVVANGALVESEADITANELRTIDTRISSFTTYFSPGNSGHNIQTGASYFNNTLLMPGEEFSCTDGIGPTTAERGFVSSNTYVGGQVVPGMGGGVCQIATTLYNAELRAGILPTERQNHMMTVGYVGIGLDATLADDLIDLRFVNTYDYPLIITTSSTGGSLTVEIWSNSNATNGYTYEPRVEAVSSLYCYTYLDKYDSSGNLVDSIYLNESVYQPFS